jgi:hypothetical protein
MPARRDFDALELTRWMGELHLVEVIDGGRDFLYRIFATNIAGLLPFDMTGRRMSEFADLRMRAAVISCYREIVRMAAPYLIRRPAILEFGAGYMTVHEYLALPLGDDGQTVDRMFVLNNSKARRAANSDAVMFLPLEGDGSPHARSLAELIAGYTEAG